MKVRVRMAPSPTGEYHIGHIRTVLYNYALARKNDGKFILRIEDTDRGRYVDGAIDRILDVITDYGFTWDEGLRVGGPFGPYVQSERLDLYKKYALELVEKGQAYYCFCTSERLTQLREEQQAAGLPTTKYDRKCLNLSKEEVAANLAEGKPYVIRLKVPDDTEISFHDEVLGDVTINSNDTDDQVLLKTDGFPTYHLGVVVDDHLMDVTHVMRGIDWLPSTPKHILLYKAFGWELPKYVHLPNLKELGGTKKLSKRFGSVAAIEFLQEGYLSEALVNFVMFLGWNPGTEKEIYTMEEFVDDFSIEKIHKTDLVAFDRQKLLWMNGTYIRSLNVADLYERLLKWATKFDVVLAGTGKDKEFNLKVLSLAQERLKKFDEYNEAVSYFYSEPVVDMDLLNSFSGSDTKTKEIINNFVNLYKDADDALWTTENLDKISHESLEKFGYSPKEAFMTLRIALTGNKSTPPLFDVMSLLGKVETLKRFQKFC